MEGGKEGLRRRCRRTKTLVSAAQEAGTYEQEKKMSSSIRGKRDRSRGRHTFSGISEGGSAMRQREAEPFDFIRSALVPGKKDLELKRLFSSNRRGVDESKLPPTPSPSRGEPLHRKRIMEEPQNWGEARADLKCRSAPDPLLVPAFFFVKAGVDARKRCSAHTHVRREKRREILAF